jgi:integrase
MSRAGLAPLTVRGRLSSVRRVLRAAVADGILMRDPTAGVKAPRTPTTEETNIPTTAEVAALLAHLREPFRAMATVCALAGLRLGEVGGLQAGDLDAAAAVLRVRRQSQPVRGAGMGAVPPKSASSVRDVPVPAELVRILDDAQRGLPAGAWLWSSPATGHPWRPSTLHKHMAEAAEAAGVPGIGWHSLRHYYASGLIRDGLDAVTVAGALGHSSPSVTLSVYAHVWPDASGRVRASSQSLATALLGDECED